MFKLSLLILAFAGAALCGPKEGFGPGLQDWGFVDVRPGAHMFWWLYYTTAEVASYTDRPLCIWLQGGPGASSTGYGNFEELGPLDIFEQERNFTWVDKYNVLFIDNPVGSGFSYVDSNDALTTDNYQIARDLVTLMKAFYEQAPEFKNVPLHIYSESYGGKMTIEFALELEKDIKAGLIECNLKSAVLIDSWISPMDSVNSWSRFLYYIGAVDVEGAEKIQKYANDTQYAINRGEWVLATNLWSMTELVVIQQTHGVDFYNVIKPIPKGSATKRIQDFMRGKISGLELIDEEVDRDAILQELMRGKVAGALEIPSNVVWGSQSNTVFNRLNGDFMKPVINLVSKALDNSNFRVVVVTGTLDLIVATPGTIKWINAMQWSKRQEYLAAARSAVIVEDYLEGYEKHAGNLDVYWALRSGHMVPADNYRFMDYVLHKTENLS